MNPPVRRSKKYYQTKTGKQPAREFIHNLDGLAKFKIFAQIDRLKDGNPGKGHGVGGVSELVIDFGPGYRVYYAVVDGNMVILLLTAGDKRSQSMDIEMACAYYADYLERKSKGEKI